MMRTKSFGIIGFLAVNAIVVVGISVWRLTTQATTAQEASTANLQAAADATSDLAGAKSTPAQILPRDEDPPSLALTDSESAKSSLPELPPPSLPPVEFPEQAPEALASDPEFQEFSEIANEIFPMPDSLTPDALTPESVPISDSTAALEALDQRLKTASRITSSARSLILQAKQASELGNRGEAAHHLQLARRLQAVAAELLTDPVQP